MAHIIDTKIDTSFFDKHFHNDETGAPAYDPKALLKVILFAYSKGILSSRRIETACRENIIFMALSGTNVRTTPQSPHSSPSSAGPLIEYSPKC